MYRESTNGVCSLRDGVVVPPVRLRHARAPVEELRLIVDQASVCNVDESLHTMTNKHLTFTKIEDFLKNLTADAEKLIEERADSVAAVQPVRLRLPVQSAEGDDY